MSKTVGLFGITGNPPHSGHIRAALTALNDCDEVWLHLVWKHPFGKTFVDYDIRKQMLNILLKESVILNPKVKDIKVVDLDKVFFEKYKRIPYSYDLLTEMKNDWSEYQFKLVIGEDNYRPDIWGKFFKHKEIENEFGVIVVPDRGVHSTEIRKMVVDNNWLSMGDAIGLELAEYIKENKLFLG